MYKRFIGFCLAAVLLLAGCSQQQPTDGESDNGAIDPQPEFEIVLENIEADSIQYFAGTEDYTFAVIERNGKFGLIDYTGKVVLEPTYVSIELCETMPNCLEIKLQATGEGYETFWVEKDGTLTEAQIFGWGATGGYTVYWYNGQAVMFQMDYGPIAFSKEVYDQQDAYARELGTIVRGAPDLILIQQIGGYTTSSDAMMGYSVDLVSEQYALFDTRTGKLVTDFIYEDGSDVGFIAGVMAVKYDGAWGYIKEDGSLITDFAYDTCAVPYPGEEHMFSALNGHIVVRQGDKWGLIDTDGNTVISAAYTGISQVNSEGLVWLEKDGSWMLVKIV